jgi:Ca2+-binding EF-hand superfamily protein
MKRIGALVLAASLLAISTNSSIADPPAQGKVQQGNPEAVFKKIDTNGDGKLSREEFKAFIEKATKGKLKDRPELIDKLFDRLDANGDGYLSLGEFKKLRDIREKLAEKKKARKETGEAGHKE